jgi:UDP-GlcNAc:undecaprenyl-phosphate GlcNAc-1-phosphate transferase
MVPLTAGVVSFVWSWLSPRSPFARILSDDPSGDALKIHQQPIPPIGGIGIYLALLPAFVAVGDVLIWLAASGALALGVLDDRWSLAPRTRLGFELLVGFTLALSPEIATGWQGRIVVAMATVVLINAINLYDGLDGLAGGALVVSALGVGLLTDGLIAYSLGAALIGFLVFNWHPAKLFLGDGGAYLVAVAFVAAASTGGRPDFAALLVMLGMAGVVLVDLLVTLIRRARAGAALFQGDRSHLYDQLVDRGWRVPTVAATSTVVQCGIAGIAVLSLEMGGDGVALAVLSGVLLGLVGLAAARGFTSSTGELI